MKGGIKHLDLFSGIGGFSLALDQVIDSEHIFCDNDLFCQEVLKKNYPNAKIYGDIKEIKNEQADIVTGGFPCQPFSQAGKRRGTADDRYLWPEMFRVICLAKPTWVIAENVSGILTWNEGMVFEQVCSDLESEGYEVQTFVIPACAKNAPHRRDRVWFIAHNKYNGRSRWGELGEERQDEVVKIRTTEKNKPDRQRWERKSREIIENDWIEVATEFCRMDDGIPNRVDRIKSLGNAIVPQVAEEIMRGIFL